MSPHTSQVGGGFDYMPSGIYKHKKGYKRPPFSEKTKKKMSEAKMGDKNPAKRPEVIEKIRKTLLGRKKKLGYFFSPETIRNFSITRKGKKRLPFSKEWRKRISEGHKGSKHYNWQGGKSYEQYTIDWTKDLKESIRKRDSYVCQLCGIDQKEFN